MFLTHHKDTKRDGTAPAWVYGYGGFNIALNVSICAERPRCSESGLTPGLTLALSRPQPTFSASLMSWVKTYGGVLAWPNIRGGE